MPKSERQVPNKPGRGFGMTQNPYSIQNSAAKKKIGNNSKTLDRGKYDFI